MQITSIMKETVVAPVPLTAKINRIEIEKSDTARTIDGSVEILAAINSLSLVKMESIIEGAKKITASNIAANEMLSTEIFLMSGIT